MYANRENVDLIIKLGQIISSVSDLPEKEPFKSLIVGRMLWTLTASAECLVDPDERCIQIKSSIIEQCLKTLQVSNATSVRLIGTKALVKFSRKMPL